MAGRIQRGATAAACEDPEACYSLGKVRALFAVCAETAACLWAELPEFAGVSV